MQIVEIEHACRLFDDSGERNSSNVNRCGRIGARVMVRAGVASESVKRLENLQARRSTVLFGPQPEGWG